ncbi:MAG TPA: hypothetical protein VK658_28145 [Chryseolinea sp.]|nr:hypothetical protein [Chryseolinea sp.]
MKQLLVVILAFVWINTTAQEKELFTVDAKEVSAKTVPSEVVAAVEKDFAGHDVLVYYMLAGKHVDSEWSVTGDDKRNSKTEVDYYTVSLKGKNGSYIYGLYAKDGTLLKMKVLEKDFELPASIRTAATSGDFSGYTIKSDRFVKVVDKKTDKEYVEVVVEKGGKAKKLYFDTQGNLIKR